jgi:hypothetical protein
MVQYVSVAEAHNFFAAPVRSHFLWLILYSEKFQIVNILIHLRLGSSKNNDEAPFRKK